MRLVLNKEIHFQDIGYTMPVGVLDGVSKELLFFAKEVCNLARRSMLFADIRNHPEYSDHSLATPIRACCCCREEMPHILIFIIPERCSEGIAIHEMTHAWLLYAEGYEDANRLRGDQPFYIKLFAGRVGNIASDLHVNATMKRKGFEVASLRELSFAFLDEWRWTLRRAEYAEEPGIQWQLGSILGHLHAGSHFYHFTGRNRRFLEGFERFCRKRAPGVLYCRDLIADAAARTGYDTSEKVARFVDLVTPKLFAFLGEEFKAEYLRAPPAPVHENMLATAQAAD